MKEKLAIASSALLLVFVCLFIYSCQEDLDEPIAIATAVPDDLLNAAKEWHLQNTQSNTSSRLSNSKRPVLPPTWKDAALNKLKNGKTQIVVPSPEFPLGEKSTRGVVRKFVFDQVDGKIAGGRIIEIFGDADYVADHKKNLLESYEDGDLNNFTGGVIVYDVNYHYLRSFIYKNGELIPGWCSVGPKPQSGNKSGRVLACYDYWLVHHYEYYDWYEWLYYACEGEDNEYGGDITVGGGGSGGGGGPSYPSNPQNNQIYVYTDNQNIYTVYKFNGQIWIPIQRIMPEVVITAQSYYYPELAAVIFPVQWQVVYTAWDQFLYVYDEVSAAWVGELQITNDVTNPCMKQLVENAISTSAINSINNLILNHYNENNYVNLTITQEVLPNDVDADTGGTPVMGTELLEVEIALNSATLPGTTQEYIIVTIYHELLHAVFFAESITDQHTAMANDYVSMLSSALQSIFPGIPSGDATKLAWGGLQGTSAWNALSEPQRTNIIAVNAAYRNHSSGTVCP